MRRAHCVGKRALRAKTRDEAACKAQREHVARPVGNLAGDARRFREHCHTAIDMQDADALWRWHGGDQPSPSPRAGNRRHILRRAQCREIRARQTRELPEVGGEHICLGHEARSQRFGDLRFDVETRRFIAHHRIDDDDWPLERVAVSLAARCGAHLRDRLRGYGNLLGMREMTRDHSIDQREQAVRGDPFQHLRHHVCADGASARRPPAGMAAEQAGGHMDRIDLHRAQHVGRYAPANAGSGDIG